MDKRTTAWFEARANVVKALAHASRLRMVYELAGGERCVQELQELVGGDVSTVSNHLAVLRNAGIVADEKRGLHVFYRLRVPCIASLFGCIEVVVEAIVRERLDALK